MKIWIVTDSVTGLPAMTMKAEDEDDVAYLGGLKGQMDQSRKDAVQLGVVSADGATCQTECSDQGITKIVIRLILGNIEIVTKTQFPPPQEDRQAVRLVAARRGR